MAMTTCNECGRDISDTVKKCPHCGKRKPRSKKLLWWFLGFAGVGGVIQALVPQSPSKPYNPCTPYEAYIASKGLVARGLKSPSTAKFERYRDANVARIGGGTQGKQTKAPAVQSCRYRVTAYVDSQNSFGAMLRTQYQADVFLSGKT